jgi:large subunit ribosomal protein L4
MAVATYSKTGTKATTPAKLDKTIFEVEVKDHELLKQAYVAYMANGRGNNAVTKTRGLVRGGGRKPWRQKGTGRARFGSSRVPIWRGGGITFGPTGQENYKKQLNTKAKRQAIKQALSLANKDGKIIIIDDIVIKNAKTSELAGLLKKLGAERNTLVVVDTKTEDLTRASRNLQKVVLSQSTYLNVFNILNADHIILTSSSLDSISEWLAKETK